MRRALVIMAAALLLAGCGSADQIRDDLRARRDRVEQRIRERIDETLKKIRREIPQARRTSPQVRSRGRTSPHTIDAFLTDVLRSVDRYWTQTLRAQGLPEPSVSYYWVPPGETVATACGPAGAMAAFYCPGDDTMYVAQEFAAALYDGVLRGLPGEQAGFGRAAGDFGVAYVVAHEYAHNLQDELGYFTLGRGNSSEPFELQADCLAGTWGNSVYRAGRLRPGDVQEAINTALAVGDFDYSSANHHGTPEERKDAWLLGFHSGDPGQCGRYVPGA